MKCARVYSLAHFRLATIGEPVGEQQRPLSKNIIRRSFTKERNTYNPQNTAGLDGK
jgi:hypothetical protein